MMSNGLNLCRAFLLAELEVIYTVALIPPFIHALLEEAVMQGANLKVKG